MSGYDHSSLLEELDEECIPESAWVETLIEWRRVATILLETSRVTRINRLLADLD
jgi:hypothetical protein